MKHLLLSLALIISANAWAEDEFPIELTCEVGANIVYLYLDKEEDKSWWKNNPNNKNHAKNYQNRGPYGNPKFKDKENEFSSLNYFEFRIDVSYGDLWVLEMFSINRENGKTTAGGQCYKGFKEYEKQI